MSISCHRARSGLVAFGLLALLSACGSEDSVPNSLGGGALVKTNTPAEIAQESAADYDSNLDGLITGRTLRRWIGDWERQRPAGIGGNLIILQATAGPAGFRFIRPNNVDVYTYVEAAWTETRSNGVTEIAGGGLSGASIDRLLRDYGIDVSKDLIVCAAGSATTEAYFGQALCWYTLRYWGVDRTRLAVLSGGNAHLGADWTAGDFSDADFIPQLPGQPSPTNEIRKREVVSVKSLRTNNTALQATLADLLAVVPATDANALRDGVFLWDARSLEEYSAGEATEAGLPAVVPLADRLDSLRNGASRQSHPRGALHLDWQRLLDTATGRFKPKTELAAYFAGRVDAEGRGFLDSGYRGPGEGQAYQAGDLIYVWSETSARAAVAQLASAVILGLPTRLYEGGTLEWNSLTGDAVDRDGTPLLPGSSPWRTDTRSSPGLANRADRIAPRNAWSDPANPKVPAATPTQPRILAPAAARADAAVQADRSFGGAVDTGNSGGSGSGRPLLPPNPCGGG